MGWGALLKAAVSLGGRAIKAIAKSAGGAVVHPQQTLKGLGSATKSAAIGGSLGYIGWEKLTTKRSGYCQRCYHWRRNDTKDWRYSFEYR